MKERASEINSRATMDNSGDGSPSLDEVSRTSGGGGLVTKKTQTTATVIQLALRSFAYVRPVQCFTIVAPVP